MVVDVEVGWARLKEGVGVVRGAQMRDVVRTALMDCRGTS